MTYTHFNRRPAGYLVMIDGRVVDDAGKDGVVKHPEVALRLARILRASRPEVDVDVLSVITLGSRS